MNAVAQPDFTIENFEASDIDGWQSFRSSNADLLQDSKKILGRYYSEELLFSDIARERFVLPDNLKT